MNATTTTRALACAMTLLGDAAVATGMDSTGVMKGPVVISEFMSVNTRTAKDEDGDASDWIELWNRGDRQVDLGGWGLSDKASKPLRWRLPSTNLPPGGHMLVWASGKDRTIAGRPLHASFKLSAGGDSLMLSTPDGTTSSALKPAYPVQHADVSFGIIPGPTPRLGYSTRPTPGQPNAGDGAQPWDAWADPSHEPMEPKAGGVLTVSVQARPTDAAKGRPVVKWRRNFDPETEAALRDDGQEGDRTAGDGRWTATLPLGKTQPGDMVRWRFAMPDDRGGLWRWPLSSREPQAEGWLGTLVDPGAVTSALPVVHWFVEPSRLASMDSDAGAPAWLYHGGEFYDGAWVKVRGNTTAGFEKKSHRVEFPAGHAFRPPHGGARVRATSFMAEWGDPTYLRQHLSFWMMTRAGVAAPFHEPVRIQLNGRFHQLAMHSLPLGEEVLELAGLDPGGALYKAVGLVLPGGEGSGGFEKKTRRREGNEDYVALAAALGDDRPPAERARSWMDLGDVPATINYIAVARLCQEDDDIWANLSLYHDNDGSGRWRPVAFDMNVSWGFSYGAGEILAHRDDFRSHPFWGAEGIGSNQGHNRLYDVVVRHPFTREMLRRRMRTLMDDAWRPPGAVGDGGGWIERHVNEMAARMRPEATLDRQRWGEPWTGRPGIPAARSLDAGIEDLMRTFVEPRRRHFFVTHAATNAARPIGVGTTLSAGIPDRQPSPADLQVHARVGEPRGRGDGWAVVSNTHPFSVDLSGWRLGDGKGFTLPPGSVLPAHAAGLVVESWEGFRRRTTSPKPGEGRLVLGRWKTLPSQAGAVPLAPAMASRAGE
ncbi:MAG: CotH kinase family protein [Verrucomicrobiota bacterium]|jgi:hypothetical protein